MSAQPNFPSTSCADGATNKYKLTHIIKRPGLSVYDHLNVIMLDTSASTLTGAALQQSKAVVAAINQKAYEHRERLALVSFGNNRVTMPVAPAKPRKSLHELLDNLVAGGGTPFRPALAYINKLLEHRQKQQRSETATVYILTDGRSRAHVADMKPVATTYIIDIESGPVRLQRCQTIAQQWNAHYVHLESLPFRGK